MPHSDDRRRRSSRIPGNHDWYDGLTAFLRFFCQGGWVGGWKTEQRRSYFAVKLPQRWWLLGIDIQFDTYIDAPQIEYFRNVAAEIKEGDGIILCNAKPSWVEGGKPESKAYATLDYFITVVLGKKQDQVRLMLAGDQHHYVRYVEQLRAQDKDRDGERALITCGGGGAYLSATRLDKDGLVLPPSNLTADIVDAPPPSRFSWRAAYPTPEESRRLASRVFYRLPGRNPWFVLLMAAIQALVAYALVTSLLRRADGSPSLAQFWADLTPSWSLLQAFREPRAVVAALVLVGAMVVFSKRGGPRGVAAGLLHGLGHLASAGAAMLAAAAVARPVRLAGRGAGRRPPRRRGRGRQRARDAGDRHVPVPRGPAARPAPERAVQRAVRRAPQVVPADARARRRRPGGAPVEGAPRQHRVGRPGQRRRGRPWVKPRTQVPVHLIEAPLVIPREVPA